MTITQLTPSAISTVTFAESVTTNKVNMAALTSAVYLPQCITEWMLALRICWGWRTLTNNKICISQYPFFHVY